MPRCVRFALIVAFLLVCGLQPRAQVTMNLTPLCNESGILAWGKFNDGTSSPGVFRSDCTGKIPMGTIAPATAADEANQFVAFSAGNGVVIDESPNWNPSYSPLTVKFNEMKVLDLKVWVLYKSPDCDMTCVRVKMGLFLVWANDRLSAERTGIQLKAAGTGTDWVSDQTNPTGMVHDLVAFTDSDTTKDCSILLNDEFPIKQEKALNLYITQLVNGHPNKGVYCASPLEDKKFANGFVGRLATNSSMLHELSHNLGLADVDLPSNVMNNNGKNGFSFTEGQAFRMNFATDSAMTIFELVNGWPERDCFKNPSSCPAVDTSIWPDP